MKKITLLWVAISIVSTVFAQQNKRLKGIDKDLNAILVATKAPSFAVAVVKGNKLIYSKGFGYSNLENKTLADANTLYAIGSCSKAFTSAILGQLRQEDKVSFDESPLKYIPELKFFNDEMNNSIILKDLMSHRTGIPRHDYSWYLFPTYNKDSLLQRVAYQEPFTGVRKQWYYNNFMFLAQGIITERITGKSWEKNISERFFEPLGMSRSNATISGLKNSTNAAIGYKLKKDESTLKLDYYDIAGMSPAGSINSSVNDMSKWLITWINNGKYQGKEIIPENYVNEAISSQMMVASELPDIEFPEIHLLNYGYAWFLSSYRGHYRVEHGGNIDGFSANAAFFPSDSLGIIVLTNQNGSAVPSLVRNTIADRMLKTKKTDWVNRYSERKLKAKKKEEEAKIKKVSTKIKNTTPSHSLNDYAGEYAHQAYGTFNISNRNDSLFAKFKIKTYYLKHTHFDVFEPFELTEKGIDTTDTGDIRFNFSTNNEGEIASVDIKLESALDHPITFKHKPNVIHLDAEHLSQYVGDYDMSGTIIKVYSKNETTLYLFVKGQPEYELLATDTHKFSFKSLDGFKVEFKANNDNSIKELMLFQPNGTFTAQKK